MWPRVWLLTASLMVARACSGLEEKGRSPAMFAPCASPAWAANSGATGQSSPTHTPLLAAHSTPFIFLTCPPLVSDLFVIWREMRVKGKGKIDVVGWGGTASESAPHCRVTSRVAACSSSDGDEVEADERRPRSWAAVVPRAPSSARLRAVPTENGDTSTLLPVWPSSFSPTLVLLVPFSFFLARNESGPFFFFSSLAGAGTISGAGPSSSPSRPLHTLSNKRDAKWPLTSSLCCIRLLPLLGLLSSPLSGQVLHFPALPQ
jgi:hypothetical protein